MKKKSWYRKWWGILLIIITMFSLALGFAFVLALISVYKNGPQTTTPISQGKNQILSEEINKLIEGDGSNYQLGSNDSKITIVEFSDFACPYCKKSFSKIREISKKYKDVKLIFRDFPVVTEHSTNLALAARCAGEQGLFWLMHDKLFINQGVSTDGELFQLAKEIGANENRFKACYNNKKYFQAIEKDFNDAKQLGDIAGTPVWFINGQKAQGDIPYDLFVEIIEKILKEESN